MAKDTSFEHLSAYKDGEVSKETARYIETQLSGQKDTQDLLLQITKTDNEVKAAFDEMLELPVNLAHVAAINAAFANQKQNPAKWHQNRWVPAIAASILAALISMGLGLFAFEQYSSQLVSKIQLARQIENQAIATLLQDTLETKVSGAPAEFKDPATATSVKIVPTQTFKSTSGHWCREFSEQIKRDGVVEFRKGLACREAKGGWRRLKTTIEGDISKKL